MTPDVWAGRRVLVTGHTGFKGAWLSLWLGSLGAEVTGFSLPPEHLDGAYAALWRGAGGDEVLGDVRDQAALADVVERSRPQVVLHLAAQALVRRGYRDPVGTYGTNVSGTACVLDALARRKEVEAVVVVTTDKVYADTSAPCGCRESDQLGGADPYSASKACAELVVQSWRRSFPEAPPVVTARAGNVLGGGDRGEDRLVPDVLRALDHEETVVLRSPEATRPWQFVLEPLVGYLDYAEALLARRPDVPPTLNFGPGPSLQPVPVRHVVETLCALHGSGSWQLESSPQPPEAQTLVLDPSLAAQALGWRHRSDVLQALTWTLRWHEAQRRGDDLVALSLDQIREFTALEPR